MREDQAFRGDGVLRISSDGDDRRILLGLKFSMSRFFGYENLVSIYFFKKEVGLVK